MKINDSLEIIDLGLFIRKEKILIISDMHLGYEESLNKQGILIPKFQFKETFERLTKLLSKIEIDKIILNGDFKHEFGTISDSEWRDILKILDLLIKNCKELILIKGNHDKILDPIANKRNLSTRLYYRINDYYVCHGEVIPEDLDFSSSKIVIIGHEHPAVSIKSKTRSELYKCFLVGKFKNKKLIVIPSFNLVTEGTDVFKERLLSPFLKQDLDNFEVYVVSDKVYEFGKLEELR
ncbi:MAG: metallophosphoesterase [Candidatus Nanoarchaeia archaeon]|jgi:hypothetical protein|nr:metallophosphoesterase [Candidatus Nanoarchaeia archaeon]|tara:strand:+ start:7817 stop:8527 length:711 start_codon:yes stop_codon:yes gene_type:complete